MIPTWTDEEKKINAKNDVHIHVSGVDPEVFDHKGLPSDIHLVYYENEGESHSDAVRAAKMCDVFDVYYDKLKTSNGKVVSIKNGFGNVRPNMWKSDEDRDKESNKKR